MGFEILIRSATLVLSANGKGAGFLSIFRFGCIGDLVLKSRVCSVFFLMGMFFLGCASYSPPPPVDSPEYLLRMESQADRGVQVSAVVLSDEESDRAFGADLARKGIQPIWLEVKNQEEQMFLLMLNSIDPQYFSPSEVAWTTRRFGESGEDEKIRYFLDQHIPVVIEKNRTGKGFVYTNRDPGGKAFGVTLVGNRDLRRFEFVQEVPGLKMDWMHVDFENLYSPDEARDLDLNELRAYLELLPCCVLGGDRETAGDPLNIVVLGNGLHVLAVFVRQGWDMTETMTKGSVWRTIKSSVFGVKYRTSPVSPLYVYDRAQDVALQKTRGSVDERNHLRLWRAPVTFRGEEVWVGQISRDIGIKLSSKTVVTHKIDPLVDEARFALLMDMAVSQSLGRVGFVKGVGVSTGASPRQNYTLDPYYTDGLRLVVFISDTSIALDDIDWVDWETPPGPAGYMTTSGQKQ